MSDFTPTPLVAPALSGISARPRVRWPAIIAASAFLLGLGAMALGLHYWSAWFPSQSVAPMVATKGQLPVVVVPAGGSTIPGVAAPVIDLNELSKREAALASRLGELEQRTARVGNDAQAASGYATGLADACADIVTCAQSLHWMQPDVTFKEVDRILRPGGRYLVAARKIPERLRTNRKTQNFLAVEPAVYKSGHSRHRAAGDGREFCIIGKIRAEHLGEITVRIADEK